MMLRQLAPTRGIVEESYGFPLTSALRYHGCTAWTHRGEQVGSAGYDDHRDQSGEAVAVTMRYTISPCDGEPKAYAYRITIARRVTAAGTPQRLWRCPLVRNGIPCYRLVRTLYLPSGAQYFGCRHCYHLTYLKNQEHDRNEWRRCAMLIERAENLFARMDRVGAKR